MQTWVCILTWPFPLLSSIFCRLHSGVRRGAFLWDGEGLSGACLPLLDPVFPFFSSHFFFTLLSERRLAFPARLPCWARLAWGEPSLLALKSFLTWWRPFVFSSSWLDHLVNYVEGTLGSTPSPGWGPALHKPVTGCLPLSLRLMSRVRVSRGIKA